MSGVSGGWLIRMARGSLSQREFAAKAKVGQTIVSRIENGQDPGVWAMQYLARSGANCRVTFDVQSASETPHIRAAQRVRTAFRTENRQVRSGIPDTLMNSTGNDHAGPPSSAAEFWLPQVQALASRASEPEQRLQESYFTHHWDAEGVEAVHRNERDRDLIHQIGSCGKGAQESADSLGEALAQLPSDKIHSRWGAKVTVDEQFIDSQKWCRAVYAVAVESNICATAAEFCRLSNIAALEHELALRQLTSLEQNHRSENQLEAQHSKLREGKNAQDRVDRRARELKAAHKAVDGAELKRRRYGNVGGTPSLNEIGNAGERILAQELAFLSDRAWALYERMADDVFRKWCDDNGRAPERYLALSTR